MSGKIQIDKAITAIRTSGPLVIDFLAEADGMNVIGVRCIIDTEASDWLKAAAKAEREWLITLTPVPGPVKVEGLK